MMERTQALSGGPPQVIKPITSPSQEKKIESERPDKGPKTSILETGPPKTERIAPLKQSSKIPSNTDLDNKYKYSQVNVNKYNTDYQNIFRPFKKIGTILFKNPFRTGFITLLIKEGEK